MIMQKILVAILLLIFAQTAYSQVLPTIQSATPPDSAGVKKTQIKTVRAEPVGNNTQTIKFMCDEECIVLIDGEKRGHLKPKAVLKINLRKGQYLLEADGINTADEINETFVVEETGTERLFQIQLNHVTGTRVAKQDEVQTQAHSVRPDMVFVQGGTFSMGGQDGNTNNENPSHSISVKSFYISKYEVTQAQWQAVMGNNPSAINCDNCPVETISWNDAQEYCQKLSSLTGKAYRLPTEAEWEYAACGGSKSRRFTFSGSSNIESTGWYNENSGGRIHPVGQKSPNELGLYDMTGNIGEWCSDWYDRSYYASSPANAPEGPSTGTYRVIRGGSWDDKPGYCKITNRDFNEPNDRLGNIGFRPVMVQ
jgi:formylglycine-generating enzyme required for sulfatase activity